MKTSIATTREQSARLLQCGVSAESADMMYFEDGELSTLPYTEYNEEFFHPDTTPAWSLSALLGLLPKILCDSDGNEFYFSLAQECASSADYNAAYKPCWDGGDALMEKRAQCPIEACVSLIDAIAAKDNNK